VGQQPASAPPPSGAPRPSGYTVEDRELLLGVFKRYLWTPIIPRIPASITPNQITYAGIVCVVFAVLCALLAPTVHGSLWYLSALLLFLYCNLDNLDGAHARRTGQTSPLGEVLDHGLDGIATGAFFFIAALLISTDVRIRCAIVMLGMIGYSFTFFEQFHVGKLVIPMFGQLEGTLSVGFAEVVAGVFHEPAWMRLSRSFNLGNVFGLMIAVGFINNVGTPLYRCIKAKVPLGAFLPSVVVMVALALPSLRDAQVLYPAIAMSAVGASVTVRLIVRRLCESTYKTMSLSSWVAALFAVAGFALGNTWSTPMAIGSATAAMFGLILDFRYSNEKINANANANA